MVPQLHPPLAGGRAVTARGWQGTFALRQTLRGAVCCVPCAMCVCVPLFFFWLQKGNESYLRSVDFYPGNGTFDLMYYPYYGKFTHVSEGLASLSASLGMGGQELLHRLQMCCQAILGRCGQDRGHGLWDYRALFLSLTNCVCVTVCECVTVCNSVCVWFSGQQKAFVSPMVWCCPGQWPQEAMCSDPPC